MTFSGHRNLPRHEGGSAYDWLSYRCGHCGARTSGAVVASYPTSDSSAVVRWMLCTECYRGSVWHKDGLIYPTSLFGDSLEGLPAGVAEAYEETRRCMGIRAYSAAELLCRRLLMHVAADKGAAEGLSFEAYLKHLESQGYVTPPMKPWVDLVRKHGNKAAHKLDPPDQKRAEATFLFTAELLRLVYVMDHHAKSYLQP